ncbi:diguanylate cyclase (GGDEF)-like protein [Thermolongibacillus altinsuensis]|uniref:Diguanylate cyclase (GGDEF)-like protein n=1 Tax=Thermolongibacillus altinsuensis TaxID=575256 RepID=A0A4R1QD82_9BACL|nr:diguanylate cyclase [Thermolongibacillus altinsuensis]TCL49202.1 diguanylate cyclase (GGDEF)-like protein [Thermolongibacillus altinsuensis]
MDKYSKYKVHFLRNIRKRLEEWENVETIPHQDVYRLLHSIAGTATMIGLTEVGEYARKLMNEWSEHDDKQWTRGEVKQYLAHLLKLCYENEEGPSLISAEHYVKKGEEPTILLIDDDLSFLMYVKEYLEQIGWYVVAIADPMKAIVSFYDVRPDCVVIDIHMNKKTGFEILTFLKEKLKQQFVPMVMVSVDCEKETRMKSYEMGADDFIPKPFDMDEFIVRIRRQLERKKLIDELLLLDELTHVYNRKYLKQIYEQLKNEWLRSGETFCLAVLDLDYFKQINDRYGHLMGDVVLKQFAHFLKTSTRASDVVVRFGGEEFIIVFPKTELDVAFSILERLKATFSKQTFQSEDETFSCTFSCGIVEVTKPTEPLEHWLSLADSALYDAKNSGRNCIKLSKTTDLPSYRKVIKIAVVDDDAIIRAIMTDLLQKLPTNGKFAYDIQTFKDGAEFIGSDWHRGDFPCLVILDGVMPKMDGLEVLQLLRNQKDSARYKIIMLTSRNSEKDIARALEFGADDYITKPFNWLELEARIRHMLKRMN